MVTVACLLLVSAFQKEPLLLHRAKKIMDVPRSWQEGVLTQGNYDWWSNTTLVGFIENPSGGRPYAWPRLYDLRGNRVRGSVPTWINEGEVEQFSPDRKLSTKCEWKKMQLTWTVFNTTSQKPVGAWTMTSHTPEPQMDQFTGYSSPDVQWSSDGKSLYQIETWPGKDSLQAQVTERSLSNLWKGHAYPVVGDLGWSVVLDVHDGKALIYHYNLESPYEFPMQEWALEQPSATMKKWTLHAPKGKVIIEYDPSPDFKKAVWLMGVPSKPVSDDWHGYPYYAVSLWSSGLHGENMRELGTIPFPSKKNEDLQDYYQYFGEIEWNPDCKHVSFIYMRKLYWIAA